MAVQERGRCHANGGQWQRFARLSCRRLGRGAGAAVGVVRSAQRETEGCRRFGGVVRMGGNWLGFRCIGVFSQGRVTSAPARSLHGGGGRLRFGVGVLLKAGRWGFDPWRGAVSHGPFAQGGGGVGLRGDGLGGCPPFQPLPAGGQAWKGAGGVGGAREPASAIFLATSPLVRRERSAVSVADLPAGLSAKGRAKVDLPLSPSPASGLRAALDGPGCGKG